MAHLSQAKNLSANKRHTYQTYKQVFYFSGKTPYICLNRHPATLKFFRLVNQVKEEIKRPDLSTTPSLHPGLLDIGIAKISPSDQSNVNTSDDLSSISEVISPILKQSNPISSHLNLSKSQVLNLVFSGGGAKGGGYPAVIIALKAANLLASVNEITGTSVGSIITALFAAGMDALDLVRLLQYQDFSQFKGKKVGQWVKNKKGENALFSYDAQPLLSFLRENIYKSIHCRLLGAYPPHSATRMLPEQEILAARKDPVFETVYNKIGTVINAQQANITFHDLAVLSHHFPATFKKPNLIAAELGTGKLIVLNSELTPAVEIALASKASSAIPIYFAPVEIDIRGKKTTLVDGGVINNTATQYFQNPSEQTLVFVFENTAKTYGMFQALFGARWDEFLVDLMQAQASNESLQNPLISLLETKSLNGVHLKKLILSILSATVDSTSPAKASIEKKVTQHLNQFLMQYLRDISFRNHFDSKSIKEKLVFLAAILAHALKPTFSKDGFLVAKLKKYALSLLANFHPPYTLEQADNEVIYNIYKNYTFQTILLIPPQGIDTLSFEKATKLYEQTLISFYFDTLDHILNYSTIGKESLFELSLQKLYKNTLVTFLDTIAPMRTDILTETEQKILKGIKDSISHPNYASIYQFYMKDFFKSSPTSLLSKIFTQVALKQIKKVATEPIYHEQNQQDFGHFYVPS